jgi:hypothetical protein
VQRIVEAYERFDRAEKAAAEAAGAEADSHTE